MEHSTITKGYQIINERIDDLKNIEYMPLSEYEKLTLYELYIHDIQDCLYWIKKERENDE